MPKVMAGHSKTSANIYSNMTEPGPSCGVPSKSTRKRGRPRGNPRPLSEEEKKQRNAQYERERRNEAAEAMLDLQTAVGLEGRASNNEVIKTALHRIGEYNRNPPENLDDIRTQNQALADQIVKLEKIIAGTLDEEEDEEEDEDSADNDSVDEESIDEDSVDDNDSTNEAAEENEPETVEEIAEQPLQDAYSAYYDADQSFDFLDNEYCRDAKLANLLGLE